MPQGQLCSSICNSLSGREKPALQRSHMRMGCHNRSVSGSYGASFPGGCGLWLAAGSGHNCHCHKGEEEMPQLSSCRNSPTIASKEVTMRKSLICVHVAPWKAETRI